MKYDINIRVSDKVTINDNDYYVAHFDTDDANTLLYDDNGKEKMII